MEPLRRHCAELATWFSKDNYIPAQQRERAQTLLETISSVSSFEDLYDRLGFDYLIEPSGLCACLTDASFDSVFSFNVLEHIGKDRLALCIKDYYRLLKPGGYSFHMIDLSDHLSHYDPTVSRKNYLKYSDTVWQRWFENELQYFNRVQRTEWLNLFREAGFELIEEEARSATIDLQVHKRYKRLDEHDLECTHLQVVHRKPLQSIGSRS